MPRKMLDISKHQGSFNPSVAVSNGIDSVVLRVAYATSKDSMWEDFSTSVKGSGMAYGAYGFLTAHYTTKATTLQQGISVLTEQVNTWINYCKEKGFTMLAIDQERESGYSMAFGKTDNTTLLKTGVELIRKAGLTPVIYASASWINSYIDWKSIDCDFWVAYYALNSKDSDFIAYSDGSIPSGTYGSLMSSMKSANKLFAWQFGSTGNLGKKYGAGSDNIDRNWQYKYILTGEEGDITVPTYKSNTLKIGPVSTGDRTTMQEYADSIGVDHFDEGYYIIIGPMDDEQIRLISSKAISLGLGCVEYIDINITTEYLKIGPVSTGDRANIRAKADELSVHTEDEDDYIIVGPTSKSNLEELYFTAKKYSLGCEVYNKTFTTNGLKIGPVSTGDRNNIREYAESLVIETKDDGDYILVGPTDNDNLLKMYSKAIELGLGCEEYQINTEEPEIPTFTSDTLKIGPVSDGERTIVKDYASSLGVASKDDGEYIIVGPMSDENKILIVTKVVEMDLGCENYEEEVPVDPDIPDDKYTELLNRIVSLEEKLKNAEDKCAQLESMVEAQATDIAGFTEKVQTLMSNDQSIATILEKFNNVFSDINKATNI